MDSVEEATETLRCLGDRTYDLYLEFLGCKNYARMQSLKRRLDVVIAHRKKFDKAARSAVNTQTTPEQLRHVVAAEKLLPLAEKVVSAYDHFSVLLQRELAHHYFYKERDINRIDRVVAEFIVPEFHVDEADCLQALFSGNYENPWPDIVEMRRTLDKILPRPLRPSTIRYN